MAKEDPEDEMEELEVRLERLFVSFCTFGVAKDAVALMDGTKFAKFCKDMGLVGKNLTVTDVDIIFAQSKPKTERKINFHHFQVTLELIAKKKYGEDDPDALNKLHQTLKLYRGPRNSSVVNPADIPDSPVVARMTDTSKYTGTHKMRFDEEGKGKGLAGRDSPAKGKGKTPSVATQEPYVQGFKPSPKLSSSPLTKKSASSPSTSKKPASSPSVSKKPASSPIVARLTDTSKYTGTHKLRFDGQGRGKGLTGRDPPSKGGSPQMLVGSHAAYVQGYKHEGTYGKK